MYSTIYIYETNFQKSIINKLISSKYFDNQNILVIDASNHKIVVNNNLYLINFNKIKLLTDSIRNVSQLKRECLSTKTLVSTHFTGINALFLSSFIVSEKRILIDDGIGTLAILLKPNLFKEKLKYQIRFKLVSIFLSFAYDIELLNIQRSIRLIDSYYTIYKSPDEILNYTFNIIHINYFIDHYKILNNVVGFIGSPMMDFGIINQKKYLSILCKILENHGNFTYYLHPDEQIMNQIKINGIKIVRPNERIEEYMRVHGLPEVVFSFVSSAVLNLACAESRVKYFYIKQNVYGQEKDEVYYRVLESASICEYNLTY